MEINDKKMDGLKAMALASMEAHLVPGAEIALIKGGQLVHTDAYGMADTVLGRPMTTRTHVEAASLTKPVFGYLVLKYAREGQLDLDRPLCEYLDQGAPTEDPRFGAVTAAMALSHATGLPNWGDAPLPLAFAPGEGFLYSGKAYTWLQQCVEKIMGQRLDLLLSEDLFAPLGMADAAMIWTGPLSRTYARSYDEQGQVEPLRISCRHEVAPEPNAAFSLYVTVEDYARFLLHLLQDKETVDMIRSVSNPARGPVSWGLGWGRYQNLLWHWGDNGGFKSLVLIDPETGDGFLMHTNGYNGLEVCFETAACITGLDLTAIADMIANAE